MPFKRQKLKGKAKKVYYLLNHGFLLTFGFFLLTLLHANTSFQFQKMDR